MLPQPCLTDPVPTTIERAAAGQAAVRHGPQGFRRPVVRELHGRPHPKPGAAILAFTPVIGTGEVIPAPKHLTTKVKRLRRYQRGCSRQQDAAARRQA